MASGSSAKSDMVSTTGYRIYINGVPTLGASAMPQLPLPLHLQHKPVFAVPFFNHDPGHEEETDCQYLSIGWSQWSDAEISAKVFRHGDSRWSPQSEEIPLARLVDLTSLVVLAIDNRNENSIVIPANFFENQPSELVIQRTDSSDNERESYQQSLVDNELLQRRLDKLTDVLIARRQASGTP
jgi:hypothetical protein